MILRFVPESIVGLAFQAQRLYTAPSDVGASALPAIRRGSVARYGEHPKTLHSLLESTSHISLDAFHEFAGYTGVRSGPHDTSIGEMTSWINRDANRTEVAKFSDTHLPPLPARPYR